MALTLKEELAQFVQANTPQQRKEALQKQYSTPANSSQTANEVVVTEKAPRLAEEKKAMGTIVGEMFLHFERYSRSEKDIVAMVESFCNIKPISHVPTIEIIEALQWWLYNKREFPKPADIVNRVLGVVEFKPDRSVYISCCRRRDNGEALQDDFDYIRKYENAAKRGDV